MTGVCWICQNQDSLTGEHKFKASDLRNEFGTEKMVKFVRGTGTDTLECLQGVKSRKAKFISSICSICNGNLTQDADKAYSKFIEFLQFDAETEEELNAVFQRKPFFSKKSKEFIDLYRYLGKLLGCHIVENGLVVPESLRSFVACENDNVCVSMQLTFDQFSRQVSDLFSEAGVASGYVGHDGLTVPCDRISAEPKSYESSYTVGEIKLIFRHDVSKGYLKEFYYVGSDLFNQTRNALVKDGFLS